MKSRLHNWMDSFGIILLGLFLLFSFQNCSFSTTPPETVENSPNLDSSVPEYIHLKKNLEFPMTMSFKAFKGTGTTIKDSNGNYRSAYQNTAIQHQDYSWIHNVNDEQALDLAQRIVAQIDTLKDAWGGAANSKVVTLQDAYGAVSKEDYINVWPGHILYTVGTKLKSLTRMSEIPGDENYNFFKLVVERPDNIAKKQSQIEKHNDETFDSYIVTIYKPGDWTQAEFVKVVSRNSDGSFVVERKTWRERFIGSALTENLSFTSGQAVVANPMRYWDQQLQLNLSLDCPKMSGGLKPDNGASDPYPHNGELAAEWYARKINNHVNKTHANGVEFDVARWTWGNVNGNQNTMDANNDLIADYGYLKGVNTFGLGSRILFESLRKLLGPDKILQADSTKASGGMRDYRYLSGVQMEAFPNAGDWDRFSDAFLHLRNWSEMAGVDSEGKNTTMPFSYPFSKTITEAFNVCNTGNENGFIVKLNTLPIGCEQYTQDTYKGYNFRFRGALAAATLTLNPSPFMAIASEVFDPDNPDSVNKYVSGIFPWDEYQKGNVKQFKWLGHAVAGLERNFSDIEAQSGTNLVAQVKWDWKSDSGFTKQDSVGLPEGEYSSTVLGLPSVDVVLPNDSWSGVRLEASAVLPLVADADYTIEFDAFGEDSWAYNGFEIRDLPRMITINVPAASNDNKPISILIGSKPTHYQLSFKAVDCAKSPKTGFCSLNDQIVNQSINISFGISEQIGKATIRNIKLYKGSAERWYREFEGGVVLLNMTNSSWVTELNRLKLKPGFKYRRLNGSIDSKINNGQEFDGVIPALDAVFLEKYQ